MTWRSFTLPLQQKITRYGPPGRHRSARLRVSTILGDSINTQHITTRGDASVPIVLPAASKPLCIRMHASDNVAIVVSDGGLPAGTEFSR